MSECQSECTRAGPMTWAGQTWELGGRQVADGVHSHTPTRGVLMHILTSHLVTSLSDMHAFPIWLVYMASNINHDMIRVLD